MWYIRMTIGAILMAVTFVLVLLMLKKSFDPDLKVLLWMAICVIGVTGMILVVVGVDSAPFPKTPRKKE